MTWFFLTEQASVAKFNETRPNSGDEAKKMFWKTYPSKFTVQWNTVEPPTGDLLSILKNQRTAYESLVIWLQFCDLFIRLEMVTIYKVVV